MLTPFAILGLLFILVGFLLGLFASNIGRAIFAGILLIFGLVLFGYGMVEYGQREGVIATTEGNASVDTLASGKLKVIIDSSLKTN